MADDADDKEVIARFDDYMRAPAGDLGLLQRLHAHEEPMHRLLLAVATEWTLVQRAQGGDQWILARQAHVRVEQLVRRVVAAETAGGDAKAWAMIADDVVSQMTAPFVRLCKQHEKRFLTTELGAARVDRIGLFDPCQC